jgi:putative ABC transport system permease protein
MRKVALRGLLARRARLAMTALAVALGVTLVAGTYVFTDTINRSFDKIFEVATKGTDAVISPHRTIRSFEDSNQLPAFDARLIDRVRSVEGVAAAEGNIFDQHGTILDKKGKRIGAGGPPNFITSHQEIERLEGFQLAGGRFPASGDEVALDAQSAKRKDFAIGDRIAVQGERRRKDYEIVGLIRLGGVESFGGAAFAMLTLAEAQRLTGKEGKVDSIAVVARPGTTPEQLKAALRPALPAAVDVRTGKEEAAKQSADIHDSLGFLQTALLAFAGISLFVGAFIIFNTFSITVVQRLREFALLRTLGASRRQVMRSVLAEGLVIGVLGSAAGLALGIVVASGLRALFKAIGFDLPSTGTVVLTRTIVVSLVVGTVVTVLSCLVPALRATRIPPVTALREGAVLPRTRSARFVTPIAAVLSVAGVAALMLGLFAVSDTNSALTLVFGGAAAVFIGVAMLSPRLVKPIASLLGRPLERAFGITGRLARENSVRLPGRTAATAAALMIGVTLVTFASIFAAGARETISSAVDRGFRGEAVAQNTDGFSPFSHEATVEISRLPGVDHVAALRFAQSRVDGVEGNKSVTGVDPGTFASLYHADWKDGDDSVLRRLDDRSVVIGKGFAEDNDKRVGDTLSVLTPTAQRLQLRVTGILDDKGHLTGDLTVSNDLLAGSFGQNRDNYTFVGFERGADERAVKSRIDAVLERAYPQAEALTSQEFKDDQAGQIDQLLGLIYALLSLSVIVSLFGIVNTLVLSIAERTRELGMLRAVGTSRKQVKRMIRYESVITSLIGGILGLGLGILLAVLVTQAIEDFELAIPVAGLVTTLVLAGLAGMAAAVLPARRAARLDVLEALAYE